METQQLIEKLCNDATPVRPMTSPWLLTAQWLLGFAVYFALLMALVSPRADLFAKLHEPLFLMEILSLVAIVASCALSAALLSFPDIYQTRCIACLPIVCFLAFAMVIGVAYRSQGGVMEFHVEDFRCTFFIGLYALLPAIWLFYSIRQYASTHCFLAASVAALTSFGIGALAERLAEQTDSVAHVMPYHYLPMLVVAIIGPILGRKLLHW